MKHKATRIDNLMYQGCEPHWKCVHCGEAVPFHCYPKEEFEQRCCGCHKIKCDDLRGEQPMTNYVIFKDNHEEPILRYDEKPSRVEVDTPSGRYLYCESVVTHPTGWHHKHYQFYRYRGFVDCQSADWVATDNIKEFCFKKEN